MNKDEQFELFYPIAQMEAKKIKLEFCGYLRLYEEDDLINWAYVSKFWVRYVDSPGALRQIIRFSMLRGLAKAQGYDREVNVDETPLDFGIPYQIAQRAGMANKNEPRGKFDQNRVVNQNELADPDQESPIYAALLMEIKDTIRHGGLFNKETQQILLRRLFDDETFTSISRSIGMPRNSVQVRFTTAVMKLRRRVDDYTL